MFVSTRSISVSRTIAFCPRVSRASRSSSAPSAVTVSRIRAVASTRSRRKPFAAEARRRTPGSTDPMRSSPAQPAITPAISRIVLVSRARPSKSCASCSTSRSDSATTAPNALSRSRRAHGAAARSSTAVMLPATVCRGIAPFLTQLLPQPVGNSSPTPLCCSGPLLHRQRFRRA